MKYYILLTGLLLAISWQGCDPFAANVNGNQAYVTKLSIADAIDRSTFNQSFTYDVGTEQYSIEIPLSRYVLEEYGKLDRALSFRGPNVPKSWESDYYNHFLSVDVGEELLSQVIFKIKEKNELSEVELIEHLVGLVQSIPYDWEAIHQHNDQVEFPYETLFAKKGTCSDKSLILAKLLALAGYDAALLAFPDANHIAVGLKVGKEHGNFGTAYVFIETTDYTSLGVIPQTYLGSRQLDASPTIIPLYRNGTAIFEEMPTYQNELAAKVSKYGETYATANAKEKKMLQQMYQLNEEIETYKLKLAKLDCENIANHEILKSCQTYSNEIYERAKKYNDLILLFNTLQGKEAS